MAATKKQKELSKKQSDHLLSIQCATLWRTDKYRANGVDYLGGAGKARAAGVYDNRPIIVAGLQFNGMDQTHRPDDFYFSNFKKKPASVPYQNAGHHLLSCDVFNISGGIFDPDELIILAAVDYDVNRGENQIFLPGFNDGGEIRALMKAKANWQSLSAKQQKSSRASKRGGAKKRVHRSANIHRLPCHYDFHAPYIKKVTNDMKQMKQYVRSKIKNCEDWTPPKTIVQELTRTEQRFWNWIVAFGRAQPLGAPKSLADIGALPQPPGNLRH